MVHLFYLAKLIICRHLGDTDCQAENPCALWGCTFVPGNLPSYRPQYHAAVSVKFSFLLQALQWWAPLADDAKGYSRRSGPCTSNIKVRGALYKLHMQSNRRCWTCMSEERSSEEICLYSKRQVTLQPLPLNMDSARRRENHHLYSKASTVCHRTNYILLGHDTADDQHHWYLRQRLATQQMPSSYLIRPINLFICARHMACLYPL